MLKYNSVWYGIFFKGIDVPIECYAAESVAKDQAGDMNWAENTKDYYVKPVVIHLTYEE